MTFTAPDPVTPDRILAIERHTWRTPAAKAQAIAGLGVTEARYYQLLNTVIDTPEAAAADPVTVHRLRARRASRLALRAGHESP